MIETQRLILRVWQEKDIDDLVEGINNKNVSKWMASAPYPYTKEDAKNYILKAQKLDDKNIKFAIVLKSENKVIGGTELTNINKKDGLAGGGIWLNEKYHGLGLGTEAFCARIKYAFDILGLRRIENGYFPNNTPSKMMQLKLGYKEEGLRRKRFYSLSTKEYIDECITGLLKEEFIEPKNFTFKVIDNK